MKGEEKEQKLVMFRRKSRSRSKSNNWSRSKSMNLVQGVTEA
jgi:hypothetical protein